MVDFINDAEQQYEAFCKVAEEYGFLDVNAAKSGFRCAVKKPEFNAGWIAFTSAISTMKDHLSEKQAEINELKAKLEAAQVKDGFVLVPKECPDPIFADKLFDLLCKKAHGEFGDDQMIFFSDINESEIWEKMIEAAQGEGHD